MALAADQLESLIKATIPDAEIAIKALVDDGDHYHATICSKAFIGKSRVQQHMLVYKALGDKMGGQLHALSLTTLVKGD